MSADAARRLRALYDALDFLASLRESNDLKVWSRMLEKTAAALDADGARYLFYDTLAHRLVPFRVLGGSEPAEAAGSIAVGEGLCGWTAKFREPVLVADAAADPRYRPDADSVPGIPTRSALCVPLFTSLDFAGVYALARGAGGAFGEEDLRLARALAEQCGAALRRLKLEEMVNRVTTYNASILDNLSGGFLAVDRQGRVMICNPAAKRMLAISGETVDRPVEAVLGSIPELADVLRRTLASKKTEKRQDLRWSLSGQPRHLGYSTLLIQDAQGAFAGAGVTFQDLTGLAK